MDKQLPPVIIYTDGACNPNPGPGGWGAILLRPDAEPQELCGAQSEATNNQMELKAVSSALNALSAAHSITLYTDSNYLRQGITEWLPQWQARGWRTSTKSAVKNQAYWQELAEAVKPHQITWKWVKGHAGNHWNERADELARSMIPTHALPLDDETAIHIFAAASYLGKQKQGGWGVILRYRDTTKNLYGHEADTSANRMHLLAAINGLQAIKRPLPIHFYTSSDYVRDGITKWVKAWQRQQWKTKAGKPVSNQDLWKTLLEIAASYQVKWHLATKQQAIDMMIDAKALSDQAARGDIDESIAE